MRQHLVQKTLLCCLLLATHSSLGADIQNFTDADLRRTLQQESRTLFYCFSPRMPLSVDGLKEVQEAALDLHIHVVFLVDPFATETDIRSLSAVRDILPQIRYQKSQILKDLGLQLHFPSLVLSNDHQVASAPIPGFKRRAGYVTLVSDLLKLSWEEVFHVSESINIPRRMDDFFKPLYGTDFIVSGNSKPNYLFNLKTGDVFDIANADWGDPGASPDGEFVTLLGVKGLAWFSVNDILAGNPQQLLKDPGLRTYQSMGILSGSSTYRVLGAESTSTNPTGLLFRDYEGRRRVDGGQTVAPLMAWQRVCEDKSISIPMMSKTGLYLSGMHEGTLKVFRIGHDGRACEEVFNSNAVTGKADFSVDDRFILFVSRSNDPSRQQQVDTVFLADLHSNQAKPIYYGSAESQLLFPGFMSPDQFVVYEQASRKLILIERSRSLK